MLNSHRNFYDDGSSAFSMGANSSIDRKQNGQRVESRRLPFHRQYATRDGYRTFPMDRDGCGQLSPLCKQSAILQQRCHGACATKQRCHVSSRSASGRANKHVPRCSSMCAHCRPARSRKNSASLCLISLRLLSGGRKSGIHICVEIC